MLCMIAVVQLATIIILVRVQISRDAKARDREDDLLDRLLARSNEDYQKAKRINEKNTESIGVRSPIKPEHLRNGSSNRREG